jgi:hypothetical protein
MIRATRLVVAVASFGAAAAICALPAEATATSPTHVGIVVRLSSTSTLTACVTQGGSGLDLLVRGFPNTDFPTSGPYAGFVVSINDVGQNPPDDTHYWSYWHATANGWKYSSSGGASYTPKAGAVEGWSYVDGQNNAPKPPRYSYEKLCGGKDPKPAPTSTHPTPSPTHRPARSSNAVSAPTQRRPSRAPHTSTARTSPSPSSSAPASAPKRHAARSHSSNRRSVAAKHARATPRPTTDAAAGASSAPASPSGTLAAAQPSPSLQPTADRRSTSGFPAVGTVLAVVVVAALGGVAWLRHRRRPE